jgi:hypothetical protein
MRLLAYRGCWLRLFGSGAGLVSVEQQWCAELWSDPSPEPWVDTCSTN